MLLAQKKIKLNKRSKKSKEKFTTNSLLDKKTEYENRIYFPRIFKRVSFNILADSFLFLVYYSYKAWDVNMGITCFIVLLAFAITLNIVNYFRKSDKLISSICLLIGLIIIYILGFNEVIFSIIYALLNLSVLISFITWLINRCVLKTQEKKYTVYSKLKNK